MYFLTHDDIRGMLALAMPAPSADRHSAFNQDIIRQILHVVARSKGAAEAVEDHVRFIISSSSFQASYEEEAKKTLESGGRIFLVASYLSVGTGVNLRFRDPDPESSIVVWDDGTGQRDFDAIYLDRPTNLAPYCHKMSVPEVVRSIFEVAELYEHDELGRSGLRDFCKHLARCVHSDTSYGTSLRHLPSVRAKGTRFINQAIGRISRTGRKSKRIHILYDTRIASAIDPHAMDGQLVNVEFRTLMDTLSESVAAVDVDRFCNGARRVNRQARATINECIQKSYWTADDMLWWRNLREAVLAHPTWDPSEDIDPELMRLLHNASIRFPVTTSSYTYDQTDDYADVKVSFDPASPLSREVSCHAAHLDSLARVPQVRELFADRGWPFTWRNAKNVICPSCSTTCTSVLSARRSVADSSKMVLRTFLLFLSRKATGSR